MSAACPTFGFIVRIDHRDASVRDVAAVRADFEHLLAAKGWLAEDMTRGRTLAVSREGTQATDSDRRLLVEWAQRWSDTAVITISDLLDLKEFDDAPR